MRTALLAGITFGLLGVPALAQPDLVVTDITVSPALPSAGEGILLATVANVGDVSAGGILATIDWTAYRDSFECDTGVLFPGLDPGETRDADFSSCVPGTPGTFLIRFDVDTNFEILESNEVNNDLAETITWYLFADGFETGDTFRWSAVVP